MVFFETPKNMYLNIRMFCSTISPYHFIKLTALYVDNDIVQCKLQNTTKLFFQSYRIQSLVYHFYRMLLYCALVLLHHAWTISFRLSCKNVAAGTVKLHFICANQPPPPKKSVLPFYQTILQCICYRSTKWNTSLIFQI